MSFAIRYADRACVLLEQSAKTVDPGLYTASEAVRSAVQEALLRGETHYTDRPGILPLRQRIAASISDRFKIAIDPKSDTIVTCGVTEARFVAVQQLLKPGETIGAPVFPERVFGAALLRRAELLPTLLSVADLVYLTSSTPEPELRASLAQASATALILFEIDDLKSRFHPSHVAGFEDRTVTIGQLGDPSWRIGYLASPGSFSPALRDFKQALTICSTNLSQWAALAFEEQS